MALSRALRDVMRKEDGLRKKFFTQGLYTNEEPRQRHAEGDMVRASNQAQDATRQAQQRIRSAFNPS